MGTELARAEYLGFLMPYKSESEGRGTQEELGAFCHSLHA